MRANNKGFFLVEVVISVTILIAVSFGFLNLYSILKESGESNYQSSKLLFFSEYMYHLLSKSDIPDFNLQKNFYVYIENNVVNFTENPSYNTCKVDFFIALYGQCSHDINLVYSHFINNIPYKIYKVNITYFNEKINFYIIK